ncbi:MAG: zinc ribbon domain-containing protein [Anaerolineaceae bacterium]
MTTYYEFIHVEQNASSNEIEAAIDTQYDKWRQLISHHDPQIAAQANQAILLLEQIRDTLMNKKKREIYDSSIIDVDGLADPDAFLQTNFVPPFSTPKAKPDPKASTDRTDAWICTNPSCKKANRVGEQFCAKCGARIGLECPKCGEMSELSNPFCSSCGVDKKEFFKSKQESMINNIQHQINTTKQDINTLENNLTKIIITTNGYSDYIEKKSISGCLSFIIYCLLISLYIYFGYLAYKNGNAFLFIIELFIGYLSIRIVSSHIKVKPAIRDELLVLNNKLSNLNKDLSEITNDKDGTSQVYNRMKVFDNDNIL